MTSIRCKPSIEKIGQDETDFGMKDQRGRAVGFVVYWSRITYTPDESAHWLHEPGVFIRAVTSPTRDGKDFGASTRGIEFHDTAAGRRAANKEADRRRQGCRARYMKKNATA